MSKRTLVSVICLAYNQEKFIKEALDGFVMQETNFDFEVIVHDDASTDNTATIIKQYEEKYKHLIKPIYQKVNQFSSGNSIFINQLLRSSSGTYIALCEGDDYWTDPYKLQKQVDFLESHANIALCFHPVKVVYENGEEEDTLFPKEKSDFTIKTLLDHNYIQTNSVMYRRQNYESLPIDVMPRDWYLHLYHASFGDIGFIKDVMAVYRRHSGGVWWDQRKKPQEIWKKYGYNFLRLLHEIMILYGDNAEYRKIIDNHIAGSFEAISAIKPSSLSDIVAVKSIGGMPSETWDYIKDLIHKVSAQETQLQKTNELLKKTTVHFQEELDSEREAKVMLANDLHNILTSKLWKVLLKVRLVIYIAKHPIKGVKSSISNKGEEKK